MSDAASQLTHMSDTPPLPTLQYPLPSAIALVTAYPTFQVQAEAAFNAA